MLDLNDIAPPRPEYDLDDLSARLADRAQEWVPELFPRGRIVGEELRLANIGGAPPRREGSCVIKLKGPDAGSWYDHSLGKGGKPLSTLAEGTGLREGALIERAAEIVGAAPRLANGHDRSYNRDPDKTKREIDRIVAGSRSIARTEAETYLNARRVDDPRCDDLLFNPDVTDYQGKIGRPAMIAIVRRPDTGERTGGIHRTYLSDDGSAKADMAKAKMMLGPCAGVVMLMPMSPDGVLGIGEGIETSLAGGKIFGVPAWAALSSGNLQKFIFPSGLRRLLIFADHGEGGLKAAWELFGRAKMAGIEATVMLPKSDDDFAKDLALGLWSADEMVSQGAVAGAQMPHSLPPPEILPPTPIASYDGLMAAAGALTRDSAPQAIDLMLRGCVKLDGLSRSRVLTMIKTKTGIGMVKLEQLVKEMRKQSAIRIVDKAPAWADELILGDNGEPKPIQFNVATVLREGEEWRGILAYNEFTDRIVLRGRPPWQTSNWSTERDWTDADELKATEWVQAAGISAYRHIVMDAVASVADESRFHPVRDWLDSLNWDGISRLDFWLQEHCHAADDDYTRAVGSRFLIAAVARVSTPGCKADSALILEGKQGISKSGALRALFDPWFTDDIEDLGTKDAKMQLAGAWCVEMAELDALERTEVSKIKSFLTRTNDRYRKPYGRAVVDVPRQCVFAGTVNDREYLRDITGARRFWPIKCSDAAIDVAALHTVREQLWAEAVHRYRNGEKWWLHEANLDAMANAEQAKRRRRSHTEDYLRQAFEAGDPPFEDDLLILNDTADFCREHLGMSVSTKQLATIVREFGGVELGQKRIGDRRPAVWASRNPDRWRGSSEAEISKAYRRPAPSRLPDDEEFVE